jgi:hypothetical protein
MDAKAAPPPSDTTNLGQPIPPPAQGVNTTAIRESQSGLGSAPSTNSEMHKRAPAEQAEAMDYSLMPSMMASALGLDKYFNAQCCRAYLDKILQECGNPSDPVEVMVLKHLVLANFRAAQLQGDAANTKSLEGQRMLNCAGVKFLSEFRSLVQTLVNYRAAAWKLKRLSSNKRKREVSRGEKFPARRRR